MGNIVTADQHVRRSEKCKHQKEVMPRKEDRATQYSLLVPQTASAPTRKSGPCAKEKIQVGMKSCLTDQSTQTVSNSMIPSTRVIRNYDGNAGMISMTADVYNAPPNLKSFPLPHSRCNFVSNLLKFINLPSIEQLPLRWLYETPQRSTVFPCLTKVAPSK